MERARNRLDGLQLIRAVAALMVVVDHSILNLVENASLTPNLSGLAGAFGNFGVGTFFAISGYIMAYTTVNSQGAPDAASFLTRRIWRIVPLYWLITGLYIVRLYLGSELPSFSQSINSFLFLPTMDVHGAIRPIYGLGWTLNYEMFFYLIFSLSILMTQAVRNFVVIAVILVLVLSGFIIDGISVPDFLSFYTNSVMIYFAAGVFIFEITRRGSISVNIPIAAIWPVVILGMFALYSSPVILADLIAVVPVSLVLLIAVSLRGSSIRPIWLALGDASYSIYLTHSLVLGPASKVWAISGMPLALWPIFVVVGLFASSLVGWVTYKLVERPLLDALRPIFGIRVVREVSRKET